MASASTPVIAPQQNHLWDPSQPIRFAPTTMRYTGYRTLRAAMTLASADKVGTSKLSPRVFFATASRPKRGGRAFRPSLASKGDNEDDFRMMKAVEKRRTEAIEEEKKRPEKKRAKQEQEEAMARAELKAEQKKERVEREARQAKIRADEVERDYILASGHDLAKQLINIERRASLHSTMDDTSVVDFRDRARLENLQVLVMEKDSELHKIESKLQEIENEIWKHIGAMRAQAQSLRQRSRQMEADIEELEGQTEDKVKFLQNPIQSVWRAISEKSLEQLTEKWAQEPAKALQHTVAKLAAAIVVSWYLRRSDTVKQKQEQTMPIFFRRDDVRNKLDRIVFHTEATERFKLSWRLVLSMIKIQRAKEVKKLASEERAAWDRQDQLWAEYTSRVDSDHERYVTVEEYESTPGYEEYAQPMRKHTEALGRFLRHFNDHVEAMAWHLGEQREKWRSKSATLSSLRGDLLKSVMDFRGQIWESTGHTSHLIKIRHLADSVESTLADITDGLDLFAAAFNYEYLRLAWHWQKFDMTVEQVQKISHQVRQQGLLRLQFAHSKPHIRLLTRMRLRTMLAHPLDSYSSDWTDMEALTKPGYHWFPPSTSRQLVDVKMYQTSEDFTNAQWDAFRAKFGPIVGQLHNLARYAITAGIEAKSNFTNQNGKRRLLFSQFSKESLAHQLFFARLQPLLDHHARVIKDINLCLATSVFLAREITYRLNIIREHFPLNKILLSSLELLRVKCVYLKLERLKPFRTVWMNEAFGAINAIGHETYTRHNLPSYADRLAEHAPRLHSWFVKELAKERQSTSPSRRESALAEASYSPRMIDKLHAIECGLRQKAAQVVPAHQLHSEQEHHPEQEPVASPSLWSRLWGKKNQIVEIEKEVKPRRARVLNPQERERVKHKKGAKRKRPRHNVLERHKKDRASRLQDGLAKELEPSSDSSALDIRQIQSDDPETTGPSLLGQRSAQTGDHVYRRHLGSRNVLSTERKLSAAISDDKPGKTETQEGKRVTSPSAYFGFKPSDPKHAPDSNFFSKAPPSSESSDHQFYPSPNNASPEADHSEFEPASEQDLSATDSGSEIRSASDPDSNSDSDSNSISSGDEGSNASGDDETYSPLEFQIPADTMRKAMLAKPGTPASFWSHKLYRGPSDEKVTVHYCRSKGVGETVAKLFLGKPVLGFDIEWKPQANAAAGLKSNVSLIQLACENRVGLFHLALHKGKTPEEVLPPTLREIISSPDVMKTGVAILSDFSRVAKYLDTQARGIIELSHWHRLVTYSKHDPKLVNKRLVSLAIQVETHLQLPLSKGDVRTSDWSKQLNHEQCSYAAADAYASYRLYEALEEKRITMNPRPPRPQFAELKMPIKLANRAIVKSSSDEDLADAVEGEELCSIEFAAQGQDFEDLTQETSDFVKYPELPPLDDYTESPPARLVGRVRLANAPTATPTKVKSTRKPRKPKSTSTLPSIERSQLLAAATTWADSQVAPTTSSDRPGHREGRKGGRAWLKCYYLWHHGGLELAEVAKIARDPPLKKTTVACYIAEAVGFGGCEMGDLERLGKVLDAVPMQAWGRFRDLKKEFDEELASTLGKGRKGNEEGQGCGDMKEDRGGDDWIV
ncbi:ribonuclease H-like protein [Venturia nashicola]|nr:ribonuclease H-like protein [Venturia nashicola]